MRDEMKGELEYYKKKLLALESGSGEPSEEGNNGKQDQSNEENEESEEGMDPKLKEAIEKMKKLDRILKKKIRKEREVKRDRLLMEKR